MKLKILLLLLTFFIISSPVSADLISTFDFGDEGWISVDPTGDYISHWEDEGGGNGHLVGVESDSIGGNGYFRSPLSWGGDWSEFIGGCLSYDIRIDDIVRDTGYVFGAVDVMISRSPTEFVTWSSTELLSLGEGSWMTVSVPLVSTSFDGDFAYVMSDVRHLWIRGELVSGEEVESFDNVAVRAAPVPEPATILLLGSGLIGLAGFGRKRFKI